MIAAIGVVERTIGIQSERAYEIRQRRSGTPNEISMPTACPIG